MTTSNTALATGQPLVFCVTSNATTASVATAQHATQARQ